MKRHRFEFTKDWTDAERRTLFLAYAYQKLRREEEGFGFHLWSEKIEDARKHRVFKTFTTVRKWIESGGWEITCNTVHWYGYLSFVFRTMRPVIPHPGQLKNKKLLADYLQSASSKTAEPVRSQEEVEELYDRILDVGEQLPV